MRECMYMCVYTHVCTYTRTYGHTHISRDSNLSECRRELDYKAHSPHGDEEGKRSGLSPSLYRTHSPRTDSRKWNGPGTVEDGNILQVSHISRVDSKLESL